MLKPSLWVNKAAHRKAVAGIRVDGANLKVRDALKY
jgi:hypothetical protein